MLVHNLLLSALTTIATARPAVERELASLGKRDPLLGITLPKVDLLGCEINFKLSGGLCKPKTPTCTGRTYYDSQKGQCVPCADPDALTCTSAGATSCENKWLLNGQCSDCNSNHQHRIDETHTCGDCLSQGLYWSERSQACVAARGLSRVGRRGNTFTGAPLASTHRLSQAAAGCADWCLKNVAADKLKLIQYTGYPGDLCECAGNSATYAETVRGGNDDMTYRVDDCNEWSAGYCERVVIVDSRCFYEHTEDQCGEK